jgi:hypothetical protein
VSFSRTPLCRADGFGLQLAAAIGLGVIAWWLGRPDGSWLGWSGRAWFAAALVVPVAHQAAAGIGWRAELFDRWFTRRFGPRALMVYGVLFFSLFALRPVVVLGAAAADVGSLWSPGALPVVIATLVAAPALWTFLSVARHFGVRRALGVDHFDPAFDEPFVRRGAFAVVPNAMYVFGFLILWAIAIAAGSRAGLLAAAFQHAFIWAHYWGVERPDKQVIYGDRPLRR